MARKSRRKPLKDWTDRGLHSTAARLFRLVWDDEATSKQRHLLDCLTAEMEHRYTYHRPKWLFGDGASWHCWGCWMCRPPEPRFPDPQLWREVISDLD